MIRDDEEHLDFAAAQRRVLYSFNGSDYCRLQAEWVSERRSHAGIVIGRQLPFEVGRQLTSFLHLASAKSAEEMRDTLEFLNAWD